MNMSLRSGRSSQCRQGSETAGRFAEFLAFNQNQIFIFAVRRRGSSAGLEHRIHTPTVRTSGRSSRKRILKILARVAQLVRNRFIPRLLNVRDEKRFKLEENFRKYIRRGSSSWLEHQFTSRRSAGFKVCSLRYRAPEMGRFFMFTVYVLYSPGSANTIPGMTSDLGVSFTHTTSWARLWSCGHRPWVFFKRNLTLRRKPCYEQG